MNPGYDSRVPIRGGPGAGGCFRWRFIPMALESAAANMAIDEALLLSYLNRISPQTIRLYGWARPSVTFGYRIEASLVDPGGCRQGDVVRRPTGGGVVYHRECVTVAITGGVSSLRKWAGREGLPLRAVSRSSTLYRAVSPVVRDALSALGIDGSLVPGQASWNARLDCFSNPCAYDIVSGGRKIYGAAQLRVGGAFLYQGNLMVDGGFDVGGFGDLLRKGLGSALGWYVVEGSLSAAELGEAERLRRGKYAGGDWNRLGRPPRGRRMRPIAGSSK